MPRGSCRSKKTGQYIKCRKTAKSCKRGSARRGAVDPEDAYVPCMAQMNQGNGCIAVPATTNGEKSCYFDVARDFYNKVYGVELEKDKVLPAAFQNTSAGRNVYMPRWADCGKIGNPRDRGICQVEKTLAATSGDDATKRNVLISHLCSIHEYAKPNELGLGTAASSGRGSARRSSARRGSARRGSARRGSARRGSARRSSARRGASDSACEKIMMNCDFGTACKLMRPITYHTRATGKKFTGDYTEFADAAWKAYQKTDERLPAMKMDFSKCKGITDVDAAARCIGDVWNSGAHWLNYEQAVCDDGARSVFK